MRVPGSNDSDVALIFRYMFDLGTTMTVSNVSDLRVDTHVRFLFSMFPSEYCIQLYFCSGDSQDDHMKNSSEASTKTAA